MPRSAALPRPDRPLRILVGTYEIAGMIPVVGDAFRANGHDVTTVVKVRNAWWPDHYDVDFSNRPDDAVSAIEFGHLVANHDVLYFQWARQSWVDGLHDLPLYRTLGKRIIYCCNGSDVRAGSAFTQLYAHHGLSVTEDFRLMPLVPTLHAQRMVELCSDLVLGQPSLSVLAVRPYHHGHVPVRLTNYTARFPDRDVPLVVHAPSHRGHKGSRIILPALERLAAEGVRFELRIVEGVPHPELLRIFTEADVVIDQTNNAIHGRTVVDAWASGCAVASSDMPSLEPVPADRPVWPITADLDQTTEQLRRLLTDRTLRRELAERGLRHAQQWHDHVAWGARVLAQLEHPVDTAEHHPDFFARHYAPPADEPIPDYLKELNALAFERFGVPRDLDVRGLAARGLIQPREVGRLAAAQRRHERRSA